jgi:acyl carrier protein phosphodiesterase
MNKAKTFLANLIDPFRPKWNHSNPNIRNAALEKLTRQGLHLEEIRVNGSLLEKMASAKKVTAIQNRLAKITINGRYPDVRNHAVEKLKALLAHGKYVYLSENAVERLTDESLLALIVKKDDGLAGRAAVEKLTDQKLLGEVAKERHALGKEIVKAAIDKLTDEKLLAEVARKWDQSSEQEIAKAAIDKLTDEKLLAEVAKSNSYVAEAVIDKLTDQKLLAEVVKAQAQQYNQRIAIAAIDKLTDQKLLAEVVKANDSKYNERIATAAMDKLTDQALLAEIASACDYTSSMAALKRVTDQILLAEIAKTATHFEAFISASRKLAFANLSDKTLRDELASASGSVRSTAVPRLENVDCLAWIATNDSDWQVRTESLRRLKDIDSALTDKVVREIVQAVIVFRLGTDVPKEPKEYCEELLRDYRYHVPVRLEGFRLAGIVNRLKPEEAVDRYDQAIRSGELPGWGRPSAWWGNRDNAVLEFQWPLVERIKLGMLDPEQLAFAYGLAGNPNLSKQIRDALATALESMRREA